MFHVKGERTPPCGVPRVRNLLTPSCFTMTILYSRYKRYQSIKTSGVFLSCIPLITASIDTLSKEISRKTPKANLFWIIAVSAYSTMVERAESVLYPRRKACWSQLRGFWMRADSSSCHAQTLSIAFIMKEEREIGRKERTCE